MADDLEVLVTELRVDMRRYETAMRKQARLTERTASKVERRYRQMSRHVGDSINQMSRDARRAIAAIALGVGARELSGYADAWVDLGNKVKAAGEVSGIQGRGLLELGRDARAARSEIEPYVDLYARILRAGSQVAENEAEIAKATQLTAKAFAAGGASAQEQAAGVLQLGQALGSGFLQGDELRSIRENAPLVAKAIADAMGVSIGELKALGAEGKLTSEIVFKALLQAEDAIEGAFGVTTPRATDAARLAFDGLKLKVGEYLEQTGVVRNSAETVGAALNFIADNVEAFADALVIGGAALIGALGAQAAVNVVSSLSSVTKGIHGTVSALTLLRTATAFLFGPVGLIIGASAAAAAIAAIAISNSKAASATLEYASQASTLNDALAAYVSAQETANGLTGEAKENAQALADAARDEAEATLAAADAKIADARAIIAQAEARKKAALLPGAVATSGKDSLQLRPNRDVDQSDRSVEQQLANIQAVEAAVAAARETLAKDPASVGGGKPTTTGTGGGNADDQADALKALEDLEEAHRAIFESEREQIARLRDERLSAIEASGRSESEKAELRSKANAIYQSELAEIRAAEGEAFDAWVDDELEKDRIRQEQTQKELDLLQQLEDARDAMAGRSLAIADREYERRREQIEDEIKDQQRKDEALRLLEEERAEWIAQVRGEVLGEGENSSDEVERVQAVEAQKLEALQEALELEMITREEYAARRLEIEQETEDKIGEIRAASLQQQLYAGQELFNGLAGLAKEFAGEQSGIYKAMFAVEKAFAIASAIVNIQHGVSRALSLPFPANLAAGATVAAQGASVVANIQSTAANFRDGVVGLRGPGTGRSDSINANISRGESVITAAGTAANPNILSAINAGARIEDQLAFQRAASSLSIGGTSLIVQGDIGTAETLSALQSMIEDRDANLYDQVARIMKRENLITTPRHKR